MKREKVINQVMKGISISISLMLVTIVVVICAQTFFRYIVFKSLSWSEEVSRFLFAILVSWGLCLGIQKDSLIRVDIIDKRVSAKFMAVMKVLYALSGVFVCTIFVVHSGTQIELGWSRSSDALLIPMAWVYIAMELGYVLALLSSILKLTQEAFACVRLWKGNDSLEGRETA